MKPTEGQKSTNRSDSLSPELQQQRSDRKSEALRGLSHELRTPLASIIGFAEAILDDPEMPDGDLRQFTEIIRQEAVRLCDTVEKVLELSQSALLTEREVYEQTKTEQLHHQ
ncbi:MAG: sensor histidine kinase [Bacteroidota bacterium]